MPVSKPPRKKNKKNPGVLSYSPEVRRVLRVVNDKKLPESSRRFIDTLKGFIEKPFVLNSFNQLISPYRNSQRRVRIRLFRILTVLITYMDWSSFRIGVPKIDANDPVKHLAMRKRYARIYGEEIPESTWFRYIEKLVSCGYMNSALMNTTNDHGEIRGTAGLKWLTMKLFKEIGFKSGWIDEQRSLALERLQKSGLSNIWPVYKSNFAQDKRADALRTECYQTKSQKGQYDTSPDPGFYDPLYSYQH